MNPRTTQDPFDEYLKGDSELTRRYRDAGREQPPLHLDSQILTEARRAVAPKRRVRLLFPERWMLPLATAATLLLAVGVVSVMSPWNEPVTIPLEPPLESTPRSATESAPTVPESEAGNEARPATLGRSSESEEVTLPAKSKQEARETFATDEAVPSMMDAPAAPDADYNGGLLQDKAGELRSQSKQESRETFSADEMPSQDDALLEGETRGSGGDFRMRQYGGSEPLDAQSDVDALDRSALDFETPEDWLAFIADLRRQGRHEQAAASLGEFRKRFPDYPLDSSQASPTE